MNREKGVLRVGDLARAAGISVRTLHYYEEIGLLVPTDRTKSGYRIYDDKDLFRLQQILIYRELDVPLSEIRRLLDQPDFRPIDALRSHRLEIEERMHRLASILATIDRTVQHLEGDTMPLTDEQLYEGLTKDQQERYPREARSAFDPVLVEETEKRLRELAPTAWKGIKAEGDAVNRAMADLMASHTPESEETQACVARHHAMLNHFYEVTPERYRGLAQLYTDHPEFRAFYDAYAPGLADYLRTAIEIYLDRSEDHAPQDQA